MRDSPPPAGHNEQGPLDLAALRDEVARLRQALREAGRQETRDQEARAAERLRHAGEMAACEGRVAEVRIDAKAGWDKAAAVSAELGRVVAEGLARLRVSQAGFVALERANAALAAGQATIAAREAELRRIVDSAVGLAILATDQDGQVVFWNAGAERLLAPDPGGSVPPSFAEAAPFEDDPEGSIGSAIAAAFRGERVSAEAWPLRRGGERLWLGVEAMPIEDSVAGPAGILWLLRDRTEVHAAELGRRESEAKYRALFDIVDEGFCIIEVIFDDAGRAEDYRFIEVNAAFERLTGLRGAAGRRARELAPALEEHWFETYGRVALTGEPARFVNHTDSLGDRWYDVRAFRIGPAELHRVAVLFDDITGMRRTEAALRESEARHRALVTTTSYVTYRMSADWSELLALEGRGFLADTPGPSRNWVEEYILPEDQPQMWAAIREAIAAKRLLELEHRIRQADGSVGWTLSRAVPLLDEAGNIREWFGAASDVTARRRAEEALRASEEILAADLADTDLLRNLAERLATEDNLQAIHEEILSAAIALTRADAGMVQVYDAGTQSLVLLATRNFPRTMTDHFHRLDAGSRTAWGIALRSGRRTIMDFDEADTDEAGAMYVEAGYRSAQATPLLTRMGRPLGMLNTHWREAGHRPTERQLRLLDLLARQAADLIEQREAQRRLRESEERLRQFGEASQDVLWIRDAATLQWTYLTPAFETIYGLSRKEALSGNNYRSWLDLVVPEDRERVAKVIGRVGAGEKVAFEYRIRRPIDGEIRWLRNTDFPMLGPGGAVEQIGGVGQDVTELKQIEAALRGEEARLRALVEGVPQLVWRAGEEGSWTWSSPQWQACTGQSEAQSHGWGWLDALHPDDRDIAREAWRAAAQAGVLQAECRIRLAETAGYGWFQIQGRPVRRDGRVVEWIGSCTDIGDQVRARQELARSAEELDARVRERTAALMAAEATLRQAQKMEAIGQLTGGIAHDFNNMLQGVVGGLDMARRRLEEGRTADVIRYTDAARDAAVRAAGLTRRLLAFARRQRLEPRAIDADGLLQGMEDLVRRSVGPSVTVELRLRDGAGRVLCDPSELESVMLNLCINARDAMPDGGRLTISTGDVQLSATEIAAHEVAAPGNFVSICVADTGTGMTPEVLEHALEPFFTTKPQGEGTGLGLSQVYGFVRQSGGVLRIDSTYGIGTTVQILLPFAAVAADAAGPEEGTAASHSARGETVLFVDDEAAVRTPAAARLRDLGYQVVEAEDGPSAIRLLAEGLQPDVLVTDVGLPNGLNGRALAEAVQLQVAGLPVVFATGYARVALPDDATVVAKPFDLDALAARISQALRRGG